MERGKEVKLATTIAEQGRQRLIRYIDEGGAPGVPDYLRTELAGYRPSSDPQRDRALETFERDCAFCSLPTSEELDDRHLAIQFKPPAHVLRENSDLVRTHVQPVIGAFPKKSTE